MPGPDRSLTLTRTMKRSPALYLESSERLYSSSPGSSISGTGGTSPTPVKLLRLDRRARGLFDKLKRLRLPSREASWGRRCFPSPDIGASQQGQLKGLGSSYFITRIVLVGRLLIKWAARAEVLMLATPLIFMTSSPTATRFSCGGSSLMTKIPSSFSTTIPGLLSESFWTVTRIQSSSSEFSTSMVSLMSWWSSELSSSALFGEEAGRGGEISLGDLWTFGE